jgi:hypothetical protein
MVARKVFENFSPEIAFIDQFIAVNVSFTLSGHLRCTAKELRCDSVATASRYPVVNCDRMSHDQMTAFPIFCPQRN